MLLFIADFLSQILPFDLMPVAYQSPPLSFTTQSVLKMAAKIAILAASVAVATAAPLTEDQTQFLFTRFVSTYNKEYSSNSFFSKYSTFKANLNTIIAHNAKPDVTYQMAVNEFADLTFEEFSSKLGLKPIKADYARSLNTGNLPAANADKKDWREEGAVNAMKNQGQCGSCWAFSANAAIEGANQIANGKLYDLSESQLVDCSASYGNHGCQGGLMTNAFEYVIAAGGLCQTKDYPYVAQGSACKSSKCTAAATIKSYTNVKANDEADLIKAISSTVVSVAVEANSNFQFYSSGIFSGPCGKALNHGIAAVGYDTAAGYYIVRNSWGTSWGEGGYIRMATGKNLCGIAAMSTYVKA